jgi:hypothetical protein
MDIVMVHTIKIFVLYLEIITAIQEHASDHCCKECPDLSTYIQTHWATHLRVSRLLNMSLIFDQREMDTLNVVWGTLGMVPLYHRWFRKGPKPYRWYIGKCRKKLGLIDLSMESLEYARRSNTRGGPPWDWGRMVPTTFRPHL